MTLKERRAILSEVKAMHPILDEVDGKGPQTYR